MPRFIEGTHALKHICKRLQCNWSISKEEAHVWVCVECVLNPVSVISCHSITSPSYSDYVTMECNGLFGLLGFFFFFFCRNNYEFRKSRKSQKKEKTTTWFPYFQLPLQPSIHQSSFSYLNQVHEGALEPTPNWLKGWDTHLDRSHLCHRETKQLLLLTITAPSLSV